MTGFSHETVPVEDLSWAEFSDVFFDNHQQGEHIALVGPNGSGKSVLGLELCKLRHAHVYDGGKKHVSVIVLATKRRDDTLESLGWPLLREWPPAFGQDACVIWPQTKETGENRRIVQRRTMKYVLDKVEEEGGHTIYIDEVAYFEQPLPAGLGLSTIMDDFWRESRSNGVTVIAGTQRPRHVSVSMWSEPAWLFVFRVDDENDLKRVAEMSGEKYTLLESVYALKGHEFLCVYRPRGEGRYVFRSKVGR